MLMKCGIVPSTDCHGVELERLVSVVQQTFARRTSGFPKSANADGGIRTIKGPEWSRQQSLARNSS